jgi:hypothetical protein
MTTILVGNNRTEEMLGDLSVLDAVERRLAGCGAQAIAWWARDGDILVLPWAPAADFLDYLTGHTGANPRAVHIVVPPPGYAGGDLLTADRLADERLHRDLRAALAGRTVDRILPVFPDAAVVAMATALGAEAALPGAGFTGQGGSVMVNSKALFRAVAAGVGVPIAPGRIVANPREAEQVISELLDGGPVMLKHELHLGGGGNEVLSRVDGVAPSGARRVVVLPDRAGVREYVASRWDWLSHGGRNRLVVERFFAGSTPVYAEFHITEDGVELSGTGEMLMEPVVVGEIVPATGRPPATAAEPATGLPPATAAELVDLGAKLCRAFGAIGYRGTLSADAVVTPAGQVLFTEANGRLTGSSHLHEIIGPLLAGPERRVLLERYDLLVPSFRDAVTRLADSGLAYDPATRLGVVLINDYGPVGGSVAYCVVAEDMAAALDRVERLIALFTDVPV